MTEERSSVLNAVDEEGYVRLSNGSKLYVGKREVTEYEQHQIDFVERMIAAGHVPANRDDEGVDTFYLEGGFCNGPGCSVCGDAACWHCRPDWQPNPCPGADAVAEAAKTRRHAEYLKLKAEFDPAQGIDAAKAGETGSEADGLDPKDESPVGNADAPNPSNLSSQSITHSTGELK